LPALVLNSPPISVDKNGIQLASLLVASSDGGFCLQATTISANGPTLKPGELVFWAPTVYVPNEEPGFAESLKAQGMDARVGWIGHILCTLKPEFQEGKGFTIAQRFEGA